MSRGLKPFWRYYGGKYRAAPHYPPPRFGAIIEPFAGAAGYSLRYPDLRVILVDKYPVIAGIWRFLISASRSDILSIPLVDAVDDLPAHVPQEARWLVGFSLNSACTSPRSVLSAGLLALRANGASIYGWSEPMRARVADQVDRIRHWRVLERSYEDLPDVAATWFVDPPYNNRAGSYYVHSEIDYRHLGAWCRSRRGQAIVCENEGASWLPFRAFRSIKAGPSKGTSAEAIWTNDAQNPSGSAIIGGTCNLS